MKSTPHEKSREPDGAAPLPPKTNPTSAGCPRRELSFEWEGASGSCRTAVDSYFHPAWPSRPRSMEN
jgi:hypothetical protein